jgi:phage shock protein C
MEHPHRKKLYRSTTNKIISGICGGIAEYINVDASVIRLIWTLVVVFTGIVPGILVYVIALFIIPSHRENN